MDLLCFCFVLCLLCVCGRLFIMCFVVTCWERADLLALVCGVLTVSLSFSDWYPVVLDCIDS